MRAGPLLQCPLVAASAPHCSRHQRATSPPRRALEYTHDWSDSHHVCTGPWTLLLWLGLPRRGERDGVCAAWNRQQGPLTHHSCVYLGAAFFTQLRLSIALPGCRRLVFAATLPRMGRLEGGSTQQADARCHRDRCRRRRCDLCVGCFTRCVAARADRAACSAWQRRSARTPPHQTAAKLDAAPRGCYNCSTRA